MKKNNIRYYFLWNDDTYIHDRKVKFTHYSTTYKQTPINLAITGPG